MALKEKNERQRVCVCKGSLLILIYKLVYAT